MNQNKCEVCGSKIADKQRQFGVYSIEGKFCSANCQQYRKSEVKNFSTERLAQFADPRNIQIGEATKIFIQEELKKRRFSPPQPANLLYIQTVNQMPNGDLRYCYKCGRGTASLKDYRIINWFVFVIVFVGGKGMDYEACPNCMRKKIAERAAIQIFTAHVVFPIVAVFHIVQFCRTFVPGHSR